jgi:DNA-binding CsgD family transcriptional regulator
MDGRIETTHADGATAAMTAREIAILQALADHGTADAVARALGLSVRTVEGHFQSIRAKLGQSTTLECVVWGMRTKVLA